MLKITQTPLKGALILEPVVFNDNRGFFLESYNKQRLLEQGIDIDFVQDNHSLSVETNTIRGLHYQLNPKAQTKLVRVLKGSIYDVIVDLRKESETFGQWVGVTLTAENKKQLLVPKGFAHGFCTLEPYTEVLYKVDEYYSKEHDRGILWNDTILKINWPTDQPVLSDKDKVHPTFVSAEYDF